LTVNGLGEAAVFFGRRPQSGACRERTLHHVVGVVREPIEAIAMGAAHSFGH